MNKSILDGINNPSDIHHFDISELESLANEIRHKIIDVMSVNGGHLASNLGTVELTIALHKAFNSPKDRLIWDVSHQTYTHKLLTGRKERFDQIRQFKGLCGFSHPKESPHDHFQAGHAATALSLALGLAHTRDLNNGDEYIIPVIGDATLTCGLAMEALNNISRKTKKFILVLNDNAMSISKNVGAITHILSRLLSNPLTNKWHQEVDHLLSKIPNYGRALSDQGHKITESLKNLVSPGAFFEQYGLSYIGPIDGHDIKELIKVFEGIKESSWPVVIHVLTRKGKGMEEAIKNPITYHGVRPFSRDTGKFLPTPTVSPTFPKIFGAEILKMAENDPSIIAVTPAMSCGSCLDDFMQKFPDRCLDVGIAESHCVTFAGGLAYERQMKVIVSIYATFFQRAFDNLFHDICLQELPVVFAVDRAGISGPDGSTHHGIYDLSFLNAMPNMVIAQPRNGQLLRELLNSAFSWERPTAIRYPNLATEDANLELKPRELGKGEILAEGDDLLIIALGHMSETALAVREILKRDQVDAAVLDPIFIKPLDAELLYQLLAKHKRIVTIEEHSVQCGLGSILNHFFLKNGYADLQILNLGIPEIYLEHGSHPSLLKEIGLTPDQIAEQTLTFFNFKLFESDLCPR